MSGCSPEVTQLALHNVGAQMVYLNTDESALGQVTLGSAEKSSLTGFFKLNEENAIGANNQSVQTLC
jgi:hypothetical protein